MDCRAIKDLIESGSQNGAAKAFYKDTKCAVTSMQFYWTTAIPIVISYRILLK
jgi:hypothetical protein